MLLNTLKTCLICCIAFLAVSCASTTSSKSASAEEPRSSSVEVVRRNFIDAVASVCGDYFVENLDVTKTSEGTNLALVSLPAGSRYPGGIVTGMPVHRASDGIVHIKENLLAGKCEVYAHGLPVAATFEDVSERLILDNFVELEAVETPNQVYRRVFEKQISDIVITVSLNGNEPGATGTMSRFSTLTSVVGFREHGKNK